MEKYKPFIKKKFEEYCRDLTSLANPIILILVLIFFFGFSKFLVLGIIGLVINETLGSLIKLLFHKKRPDGQSYNNSIEKIDSGSFPSIHSSRITIVYLLIFFNTIIIPLKVISIFIILIVGFTRVYLKKHYLVDVIGGYILGCIILYIVNSTAVRTLFF
jgi:membrane-associated phospholipid phosphatase